MSSVGPYFSLTKPRVVVLLQITALCSVLAHDQLGGGVDSDSMRTMLVVFVGGYLSAGGANAVNMWYDRDIDPLMSRTKNRPVPSGEVSAEAALAFGVALSVLGVYWFWELANPVAAVWSAFSILFYVFVYTVWLKRRTPQNIVIGGAAGAFPPMIGWAAVTGDVSLVSLSLFAIIFLWTPPHFWALALYRSGDYERAGVPMMPVVVGAVSTKRQMLAYTVALVPVSLVPFALGGAGLLYAVGVAVLGAMFILSAVGVLREPAEAGDRRARRMFGFSILYLFLVFALLLADSLLGLAV